ncbi:MAG: transcriptional regulator [Anaerolineaceae bacterium]|nr:MAG: transcriptional regulator [Anaerolineaceae bacterium]
MSTSRQRILAHLKKNRSASSREIARALKLSPPNVRHHLSVLCSDGRVELTSVKNRDGRGRPEKQYSLAQSMLGDNLPALTHAILGAANSKLDMKAVARIILDESGFANQPMNKRLALLIDKLNEMNYQAHWEAGAGGPRIVFGRCPYARVIAGHPEICRIDETMLEQALGRSVEKAKKLEPAIKAACPYFFQTK